MADEVIGSAKWDLDLDSKKFDKGISESKGQITGIKNALKDAEKGSLLFAGALAAVGAGLVAFGFTSVKAFNESEQGLAQLNAVLASTKGIAGESKDGVLALSREIQRTTTISDEAALSAINMGLTFTNIGKDIFPGFTKAVVDTAYAMNGGLKPSAEQLADTAKQLGKALQDPENGLGALHRVGVNTDELTKKFKTVTDTAERQRLIVKELNTEFGGSGAAQLKTYQGQLDHMKNIFNDFQELIGKAITERLQPLVLAFDKWMDAMGGPDGMLKSLKQTLEKIAPFLPVIIGFIIGGLTPAFIGLAAAIWLALAPLLPFLAIGALIGLAVKLLIDHFGGWDATMKAMKPTLDVLHNMFANFIQPALSLLWQTITTQLVPAFMALWNTLAPILIPILKFLAQVLTGTVFLAIMGVIGVITLIITWFANWVKQVDTSIKSIIGFFSGLPGFIQGAVSSIRNIIVKPFEDAWNAISGLMNKIRDALDFTKRHSPSVIDIVSHGVKLVNKEFQSLADVTMPSVAHTLADRTQPAQASSTQDINIHIGQVNDMQDVQAIGREIGFRAGLMPR